MRHTAHVLSLLAVTLIALGCNPSTGTGTKIAPGVGIRDFVTLRSVSGALTTRDVKPEPRPREAITGDDYFQVKLEHIFIGEALGRDVGNVVVVAQIEGVLPKGVTCKEIPLEDIGVNLNNRERSSLGASAQCAFKKVIAINPVFANGHATFDSVFITPPFRMGREHIGLRFLIAQLNDVELARQLLAWSEEQLNNLNEWGLEELNLTKWQSKLIDIGFTVANYIIEYAAKPDYVFEFETDFVPIETVGGVDTPQNLFMGGDFVLVGFPPKSGGNAGALALSEQLVFDSGSLYWKDSKAEYRDGAFIVFKVVRESRFAGELPVRLEQISREIERGKGAGEIAKLARTAVLDLQDARILNETEGAYLRDLVEWFAEARGIEAGLEELAKGKRAEPEQWPMQMRSVGVGIGPDLALLANIAEAKNSLQTLDERIFENYKTSPGMWQAECIVIRNATQGIIDNYAKLRPKAEKAFENLQLARLDLQQKERRSKADDERLQQLKDAEIWADGEVKSLPAKLPEPKCPALRD